ncbi:MAG: hypothetical protein HQK56_04990 [Deltaproteobacteria bacterium]|nr:hypothetical protein [Deltaproteobacteria bacterium]
MVDGKRTGKGKFIWADGHLYEGEFVDDIQTGKGVLVLPNGDRYEGDFADGKWISGSYPKKNDR